MANPFILLSGTAHPALAATLANELGVELGASRVERFPDGEVAVTLGVSVRRRDVIIVQPTAPPVDQNLIELLAFADACRRDAATEIVAVVPYVGYARSDNRHGRRQPIMAGAMANLMQAVGIDHVVAVDVHTPQIEGFFDIPVDNLGSAAALCEVLRAHIPPDVVVVSPDAGRVRMANDYAQRLQAPVAMLHKRRESGSTTRVLQIVGDVQDRRCLLVDDMISTGGTIVTSAEALIAAGAHPEITVAATHGLLLGDARQRLARAGVRDIIVTDTLPVTAGDRPHVHVVSIAPLIATAIKQIMAGETLDGLC